METTSIQLVGEVDGGGSLVVVDAGTITPMDGLTSLIVIGGSRQCGVTDIGVIVVPRDPTVTR